MGRYHDLGAAYRLGKTRYTLFARVKEGAQKSILAPAVFAGALSIEMSKIHGVGEERWGAAIGTAPKYWTSVLVQNIFLSCNWLQLAASLCNWLQVSVRVGVACDSRLRRVSRVGFTSIRVVVIGISIALVILHTTYSNISLTKSQRRHAERLANTLPWRTNRLRAAACG
jgi:hypothetical protein